MTTTITASCHLCRRPVHAREMCEIHYLRWWRKSRGSRHYRRQYVGYLPQRILDELEGGALTSHGLALALDADERSVHRALYRLRQRGLVETVKPYDDRTEWRRVS